MAEIENDLVIDGARYGVCWECGSPRGGRIVDGVEETACPNGAHSRDARVADGSEPAEAELEDLTPASPQPIEDVDELLERNRVEPINQERTR